MASKTPGGIHDGYFIRGRVRDAKTKAPLFAFRVTAYDIDRCEESELLGRTFTHASGQFLLTYRHAELSSHVQKDSGNDGPDVLLVVTNRFGRKVKTIGPLSGADRFAEICIEVDAQPQFPQTGHPRGRETM